jgi:transposase
MISLGSIFMIHQYFNDGISISEIARRTGKDRKTVRRHLNSVIQPPLYGPRLPRGSLLDPYKSYLQSRVSEHEGLSAKRLLRDIQPLGYTGSYTTLTDYLRDIRPAESGGYEHRFETPPGKQAQVDFAQFKVCFLSEPEITRNVWLFTMILGHSRYLFGQFVWRQTLDVVVRCHIEAFAEFGGVPQQILYDRMKTAVLGETEPGDIIFHPTLLSLGAHYGFTPKACRPYRAKTKGKIERPYRYVRQDFFLGSQFNDMTDLNEQFSRWRCDIAHPRQHGTTKRIVQEAFIEEYPSLQALPAGVFNDVLTMDRRVTRDGMVSIDGNLYSVPDTTITRQVQVERTATELRILHENRVIAIHPLLNGRGERQVTKGHRVMSVRDPHTGAFRPSTVDGAGDDINRRELDVYEKIGARLAQEESL